MSGHFQITLDTTAPVVTWGAVGGRNAGELLQVAYAVNEPGIDSAELVLADGRHLAMTVHPDRLEVLLPPDAPTGTAHVRATVVDVVLNTAVRDLAVAIVGVGTAPALGTPRAQPITPHEELRPQYPERRVRDHSSARVASRAKVGSRRRTRVVLVTRAGGVVSRPPLRGRSVTTARTRGRIMPMAAAEISAGVAARSSGGVIRRRDGRELEDALLLDLL